MSRIGKLPVDIANGAEVSVSGSTVTIKGPKGELTYTAPDFIEVKVEDGKIQVNALREDKIAKAMHGTVRSLVANMIVGVTTGYTRELSLEGVGFRAQLQGTVLTLNLGYSHPIEYNIPEGLTVTVAGNGTEIKIEGADKQVVGQAAARIRSFYVVEPYKGKGVRYKDEQVRRKVGKAVA